MKQIDMNDLSFAAKIKSDVMYVLWSVETESVLSKERIVEELQDIVAEFIEFENSLHDDFILNFVKIRKKSSFTKIC